MCLEDVGVQTLGGYSPVHLDLRTWKIPPGLPRPWCELHWHRPRPSAWHWGHTVAALGYFYPCPSTSLLLAVEPARGTTPPQRADTGFILPSKNFSDRTAENFLLIERWHTSDRMKCPTLGQGVSLLLWNCSISSMSSLNISRAGLMSSVLSLWPAHHPQNIKYSSLSALPQSNQ